MTKLLRVAFLLVAPLLTGACAFGPDGTPCYITSDFRCLEMEYQRGNDGVDPNYIDPTGAWEGVIDGEYMVFNFSALGQRMSERTLDFVYKGNNVWEAANGGVVVQFDTPDRGYIWDSAFGEGVLRRLTRG